MGARTKFPEFDGLTADEFAELLRLSKLSGEEKQVAVQCIVWHMPYVDAGEAAGGYNRHTVSTWMKERILPELRRILAKTAEKAS